MTDSSATAAARERPRETLLALRQAEIDGIDSGVWGGVGACGSGLWVWLLLWLIGRSFGSFVLGLITATVLVVVAGSLSSWWNGAPAEPGRRNQELWGWSLILPGLLLSLTVIGALRALGASSGRKQGAAASESDSLLAARESVRGALRASSLAITLLLIPPRDA